MKTAVELPSSCLLIREGARVVADYRAVYDSAKAHRLLAHLNSLCAADGTPLPRYYRWNGIHLYPQVTERIYWCLLVPIVMYGEALRDFANERLLPRNEGGLGLFEGVYHDLYGFPRQPAGQRAAYRAGLAAARARARLNPFLFYEKSPTDFRTGEMRQALVRLGIPHTSTDFFQTRRHFGPRLWSPPHLYLKTMAGFEPAASSPIRPREHPEFPLDLQVCVLRYLHAHLGAGLEEIEVLDRIFRKTPPRVIYGMDDHDSAFCLWSVAAARGIPIYGHQHGCISKIQPGWMRNSLKREDCNLRFTKLFVWGNYWRRKILQYSNLYDEGSLVIGGPMRPGQSKSDPLPRPPRSDRPLILVPYEYLVDRVAVGEYMDAMLARDWRVALKIRPDAPAAQQVANYELKHADRLETVTKTDDAYLATVHAAMGCQSTLLFEWLARGVPAWYPRTGFTMQEDMIPDGLAHEITPEALARADLSLFENRFQGRPSDLVDSSISLDGLISDLAQGG